jgi:hypothetical protein
MQGRAKRRFVFEGGKHGNGACGWRGFQEHGIPHKELGGHAERGNGTEETGGGPLPASTAEGSWIQWPQQTP